MSGSWSRREVDQLLHDHGSDKSGDIGDLEHRVAKLELVVESLWRLLRDQTDFTEEDLLDMVAAVDLEDGKYDGQKARGPSFRTCRRCRRKISKRHGKCLYCGTLQHIEPFG